MTRLLGLPPVGLKDFWGDVVEEVRWQAEPPDPGFQSPDAEENQQRQHREGPPWRAREDEADWRAQNIFWNQCRAIEYQARAAERAMQHTEYWSRADRYRDAVQALRAEQYNMGCFF